MQWPVVRSRRSEVRNQEAGVRGCEKMGTGSGHPCRNVENMTCQPVPVTFFSQPLRSRTTKLIPRFRLGIHITPLLETHHPISFDQFSLTRSQRRRLSARLAIMHGCCRHLDHTGLRVPDSRRRWLRVKQSISNAVRQRSSSLGLLSRSVRWVTLSRRNRLVRVAVL